MKSILYGCAFMRFTTKKDTTCWQPLEIGIMMGCVISLLWFVLAIEPILQGSEVFACGEVLEGGVILPLSWAFMDDIK